MTPTAPSDDGNTEAELELLRNEMRELRAQLAESEAALARFTDLEEKLASAADALEKFDDLATRHEQVVNSPSWRMTSSLRRLNGFLRRLRS